MNPTKIISWRTESGEPLRAGAVTVRPQSQALRLQLPFGGFVWNRPVAVLVEDGEGTRRVPIHDVTRIALLALAGVAALFTLLGWLLQRRK